MNSLLQLLYPLYKISMIIITLSPFFSNEGAEACGSSACYYPRSPRQEGRFQSLCQYAFCGSASVFLGMFETFAMIWCNLLSFVRWVNRGGYGRLTQQMKPPAPIVLSDILWPGNQLLQLRRTTCVIRSKHFLFINFHGVKLMIGQTNIAQ